MRGRGLGYQSAYADDRLGKSVSIYVAWLDESGSNQAIDPGTYILSAVIGEAQHAADIRNTMRALLVGKGATHESRRQSQIPRPWPGFLLVGQ